MDLRPYQRECLQAIRAAYREGRRRVLVALPTGTGKTVIFARFPEYFGMKRRLLVLAHREELLDQARAKFLAVAPDLEVEIEQGARRASGGARVVIASVPTLGRKGSRRLARLDPEEFYLLVVDEAHHATAPTYRRIFEHFRLLEPDTPRLLVGFTATPYRGDNQPLGEVFEDIAYARGIREMVELGYLCRVRGWRISTGVDLDGVPVRHGDFVESELAFKIDVAERNAAVVKAYTDLASGRRAIVFCVNVAHAQSVCAAFEAAGVPTAAVWGAMPPGDRRAALDSFAAGSVRVLTNCNVLSEGFDEPRIDCVMMARPTRSKLLYVQMVGRGTRRHPEKRDLVVIDVADNTRKHALAGLHHLFDLPPAMSLEGADAQEVVERVERLAESCPWVDISRIRSTEELEIAAERIDLFDLEPPAEVRSHSSFAWHSTPIGDYRLALPEREELLLRRNLLGSWDVCLRARGRSSILSRAEALGQAIRAGDRFVVEQRAGVRRMVDMTARWRDRPLSEPQRTVLERLGIPVPDGLTRGQASWIISLAGARRAIVGTSTARRWRGM